MNNLFQMYQQMMRNPVAFLSQKFNIPQNITDPNAILQHLLDSGQVSQEQVNQVMNMRKKIMGY